MVTKTRHNCSPIIQYVYTCWRAVNLFGISHWLFWSCLICANCKLDQDIVFVCHQTCHWTTIHCKHELMADDRDLFPFIPSLCIWQLIRYYPYSILTLYIKANYKILWTHIYSTYIDGERVLKFCILFSSDHYLLADRKVRKKKVVFIECYQILLILPDVWR